MVQAGKKVSRRRLLKGLAVTGGALGFSAVGMNLLSSNPGAPVATPLLGRKAPGYHRYKKPNILMIVTDQERSWADMHPALHLPAREALRAKSVHFPNYHVTTSPCAPSRSVMYTGQHVPVTGMIDNPDLPIIGRSLDPGLPTIGKMLKRAGYRTAYRGKWHLGKFKGIQRTDKDVLSAYGFDDYGPTDQAVIGEGGVGWTGYLDDQRIAEGAGRWLVNDAPADQPWFLSVNLFNPHDIMFFDATGRQGETRISQKALGPLKGLPDDPLYQHVVTESLPSNFTRPDFEKLPEVHKEFYRINQAMFGDMPANDEAAWLRFINFYYNCLRDSDRRLATMLAALEASGQVDNTIILFTSDHGEMAGAHGMRQKGPFIYKENLRVPLTIKHPDAGSGETGALASAVDLLPTLAAMAGVTYDTTAGVDLSSSVASPSDAGAREAVLFTYSTLNSMDADWSESGIRMMAADGPVKKAGTFLGGDPIPDLDKKSFFRGSFDGRYRFARYFSPKEHHVPDDWSTLRAHNQLELYDTIADPNELNNLADEAEVNKDLILRMNSVTNQLVEREIGKDDGRYMPGPDAIWSL